MKLDDAVVIALGSSLSGRYASSGALLETALESLADHGMAVQLRSGWWRSAAWPDPSQPAFLNGVALVETALGPAKVLDALLSVERGFGRVRGEANAPRTLDLDLIAYGRRTARDERLILPHPRAHRRRFVMGPLAEIAPEWRHPETGRSAADLAAEAPDGADAQPVTTGASSRAPHSAQDPS